MGEKKGSIFNIIVVIIITGAIVLVMRKFVPDILKQITDGATTMVSEGFNSANGK